MSINNTPAPFDKIAAGWYNYRHHTIFKTELDDLARRWKCGRLLNLGCGHGADFLPFKDGYELLGLDISSGMLKYAHKFAVKHGLIVNLNQGDMRALPYPDAYFDHSIAVASLHHVKGKKDQRQALLELYRVLRPGAEAYITVWNACQPRFWLKHRDTYVPWQTSDEVIQRFYHLFTFGEIEQLVRICGFSIISSKAESRFTFPIKQFSRNICLLIKKPA